MLLVPFTIALVNVIIVGTYRLASLVILGDDYDDEATLPLQVFGSFIIILQ